MKYILKFTTVLLIALLFTACGDLKADTFSDGSKLDASSNETMKKSVKAIMSELSPENQENFKKTLTGIYMLAQLAGAGENKSKDEIEAAIRKTLDGKTAAGVFALGRDIRNRMNEN